MLKKTIGIFIWLLCLLSASAQGAQEIVVGQAAPLSGILAETGRDMVLGARIYFEHINSQGGVNGRPIRHEVIDDGYDADRTLAATHELIDKRHAVALVGFAGTGNVQRLLEEQVLSRANIALVGPYTGADTLRTPYDPHIFHIRAGYADEMAALVKYFVGAGITSVGVLYQDDPFGKAGLQGVTSALAQVGMTPAVTASYAKNSDDVSHAVAKISSADPQGVILISVNKSSAAFIRSYKEFSKTAMLSNISVVNPHVLSQLAGPERMHGVVITQVVPDPATGSTPVGREYLKLLAKYGNGAPPSYTSFEQFLAAKILVEGVRRAGSQPSRAGIIGGLESLVSHDLGGYRISFGPNNRRGSQFVDTMMVSKSGRMIR